MWVRLAGTDTSMPCMSTVTMSALRHLMVPSIRFDWPRKLATNVERGFS